MISVAVAVVFVLTVTIAGALSGPPPVRAASEIDLSPNQGYAGDSFTAEYVFSPCTVGELVSFTFNGTLAAGSPVASVASPSTTGECIATLEITPAVGTPPGNYPVVAEDCEPICLESLPASATYTVLAPPTLENSPASGLAGDSFDIIYTLDGCSIGTFVGFAFDENHDGDIDPEGESAGSDDFNSSCVASVPVTTSGSIPPGIYQSAVDTCDDGCFDDLTADYEVLALAPPTLDITPPSAPVGTDFLATYTEDGCTPGEDRDFYVDWPQDDLEFSDFVGSATLGSDCVAQFTIVQPTGTVPATYDAGVDTCVIDEAVCLDATDSFTVTPPPPSLVLDPTHGKPNVTFTATYTDPSCEFDATAAFSFGGSEFAVIVFEDCVAEVTFTPSDYGPDVYTVAATTCTEEPSACGSATTAPYTVDPFEAPTLTLIPSTGLAGSSFEATYHDEACGGTDEAQFLLDGDAEPELVPLGEDCTAVMTMATGGGAAPGPHPVVARTCSDGPSTCESGHSASATFTVIAPTPPSLELAPDSGFAGVAFLATYEVGPTCGVEVQFFFRGTLVATEPFEDESCIATAPITPPPGTVPGPSTVRAVMCDDGSCDADTSATATYTVLLAPAGPTPSPSPSPSESPSPSPSPSESPSPSPSASASPSASPLASPPSPAPSGSAGGASSPSPSPRPSPTGSTSSSSSPPAQTAPPTNPPVAPLGSPPTSPTTSPSDDPSPPPSPSPSVPPSPSPPPTASPSPEPSPPPSPSPDPTSLPSASASAVIVSPPPPSVAPSPVGSVLSATSPPGPGKGRSAIVPEFTLATAALTDVRLDPEVLLTNLLLTLLVILLFAVTSYLFNSTMDENRATIVAWRARVANWLWPITRPTQALDRGLKRGVEAARLTGAVRVAIVLGLSGLIYGFLDPGFGLNEAGIILFVALVIGLGFSTYLTEGGSTLLAIRRHGAESSVQLLGAGILVAIACVAASRLIDFRPGFVFGFIASSVILAPVALSRRASAELVVIPGLLMLAAALGAWVLLGLLRTANAVDPAPLPVLLETITAIVFIGGLEGLFFTLIPLSFMDGVVVYRWNRVAWAVLFGSATFLFWQLVLNREHKYLEAFRQSSVLACVAVLVVYGGGTLLLWAYFRWRRARENASAAATS